MVKKQLEFQQQSFFVMLDPVAVYFTIFKRYSLFYISPINWSSLENINTVSGYSHLSGSYMFAMYIILIAAESLLSYICSIKMDIEVKTIKSCWKESSWKNGSNNRSITRNEQNYYKTRKLGNKLYSFVTNHTCKCSRTVKGM